MVAEKYWGYHSDESVKKLGKSYSQDVLESSQTMTPTLYTGFMCALCERWAMFEVNPQADQSSIKWVAPTNNRTSTDLLSTNYGIDRNSGRSLNNGHMIPLYRLLGGHWLVAHLWCTADATSCDIRYQV